jgi:hypothetical protein
LQMTHYTSHSPSGVQKYTGVLMNMFRERGWSFGVCLDIYNLIPVIAQLAIAAHQQKLQDLRKWLSGNLWRKVQRMWTVTHSNERWLPISVITVITVIK